MELATELTDMGSQQFLDTTPKHRQVSCSDEDLNITDSRAMDKLLAPPHSSLTSLMLGYSVNASQKRQGRDAWVGAREVPPDQSVRQARPNRVTRQNNVQNWPPVGWSSSGRWRFVTA
ncbi:hypothetical protein caldi_13950 [Caldinitratiruptor microaerophilus]|uniref:Uncharacterized protein n=1 Tax=Caldinitratiruptor microaerophilus TaxID=671077 RepID=A0AA35G7V2_9FIRM|nr:hypothetical protein caldi_13950 [Caldinitratiruptor microaerophilus]